MAATIKIKDNDLEFGIKKFKSEVAREGTLYKAREKANGYTKRGVRLREEKKKNTINSRRNNKNRNTNNSRKSIMNYKKK